MLARMRPAACAVGFVFVVLAAYEVRSDPQGEPPNAVDPAARPATQPATAPVAPFAIVFVDGKVPGDRRNIEERVIRGAPAPDADDKAIWFAMITGTSATTEKLGPNGLIRVSYYLKPDAATPHLRKGTVIKRYLGGSRPPPEPKRARYVQVSSVEKPFGRELVVPDGEDLDLRPCPAPVALRRKAGVLAMDGALEITDDQLVAVIHTTRAELAKEGLPKGPYPRCGATTTMTRRTTTTGCTSASAIRPCAGGSSTCSSVA